MSRKNTILFSILACLAVSLILTGLLVPIVHIVGHTNGVDKTIVYNKTVNFIQYLQDCPFILTVATDVYFTATGPIWLAVSGILFNVLIVVVGVVMLITCLIELFTVKHTNLTVRNNVLAKKLCYVAGWTSLLDGVFAIIAFIVTTLMAGGYAEFFVSAQPILVTLIGLVIIILAKLTDKRKLEQPTHRGKNALGFVLVLVTATLACMLLYVPLFNEIFLGTDYMTIASSTAMAEILIGDPALIDIPFGLIRYLQIVLSISNAFIVIYTVIGIIMSLCNKKTDWLSGRIKRWSMTLLIIETIIFALVLCQAAAVQSSFYIPETLGQPAMFMFTPWFYIALLVPFFPYIFSTLITYQKNNGKKLSKA